MQICRLDVTAWRIGCYNILNAWACVGQKTQGPVVYTGHASKLEDFIKTAEFCSILFMSASVMPNNTVLPISLGHLWHCVEMVVDRCIMPTNHVSASHTHLQILIRLSQPPETNFLTVLCPPDGSSSAPGCIAGPQLTALQPIWCNNNMHLAVKYMISIVFHDKVITNC